MSGSHVLVLGKTFHQHMTGLLYGCVTASQMLDDDGRLHAMDVRDFPYFLNRMAGNTDAVYQQNARCKTDLGVYVELCQREIDRLLLLKINAVILGKFLIPGSGQQEVVKISPEYEENYRAARAITDYGRQRGMRFMYMASSAVATEETAGDDPRYQDMMRLRGNVFTWADDELLTRRAGELADLCAKIGVDIFCAHYPDTVNENWVNRGKLDRERFGDDRAAADANVTNIFVREFKARSPGTVFSPALHPYSASYLKHDYYRQFLADFNRLADPSAMPCTREFDANLYQQQLRLYAGRPVLFYYEPSRMVFANGQRLGLDRAMLETNLRYLKSFTNDNLNHTIWLFTYCDFDLELASVYSWNPDAPGADADFNWTYRLTPFCGEANPEFYRGVIEPLCRRNFGDAAAPTMRAALETGLKTAFLLQPFAMEKYFRGFVESGYSAPLPEPDFQVVFTDQLERLRQADALVSDLAAHPERLPEPRQQRMFTYFYKEIKLLSFLAPINFCKWEARRLALAKDRPGAEAQVARGLELVEAARSGIEQALDRIDGLAQSTRRHIGRVPCGPGASNTWKTACLDMYFKDELLQMQANLATLAGQEEKIQPLTEEERAAVLAKNVIAGRAKDVAIDGRLTEPFWQKCPKLPFAIAGKLARPLNPGTARIAWDDKNLYVGLIFAEEDVDSLQGATGARDDHAIFLDDAFEIFLQPAGAKRYAHLVGNISGRVWDCVPQLTDFGFVNESRWNPDWGWKTDIDVAGKCWTAEVAIPYAAFSEEYFGPVQFPPAAWKINLGRTRRNNSEFSGLGAGKSFHDQATFKTVVFQGEAAP